MVIRLKKVKFDFVLTTKEEFFSVTYGCTKFTDSSQFLSISLDSLVKTLVAINHKSL